MSRYQITTWWQQVVHIALNLFLFCSLLLIANGFAPFVPSVPGWVRIPADVSAWLGAGLTSVCTIAVAASIYFPPHTRKADRVSYFLAPVGIAICLASIAWMALMGEVIVDVVNGVAVLGLSAGVFRMLPFSDLPNE